jgi:hypothetical protein
MDRLGDYMDELALALHLAKAHLLAKLPNLFALQKRASQDQVRPGNSARPQLFLIVR